MPQLSDGALEALRWVIDKVSHSSPLDKKPMKRFRSALIDVWGMERLSELERWAETIDIDQVIRSRLNHKAVLKAAANMDWHQLVLNGGPPCFHLEGDRFCSRAERWAGHSLTMQGQAVHKFVSLKDLILEPRPSVSRL